MNWTLLCLSTFAVLLGNGIIALIRYDPNPIKGNEVQSLIQPYYPSQYYSMADIEAEQPTLTIQTIIREEVKNRITGHTETKPVLWFYEGNKGLVLSWDQCEQLEYLFGLNPRIYKGKRVQLKLESVQGLSTIRIHYTGEDER